MIFSVFVEKLRNCEHICDNNMTITRRIYYRNPVDAMMNLSSVAPCSHE